MAWDILSLISRDVSFSLSEGPGDLLLFSILTFGYEKKQTQKHKTQIYGHQTEKWMRG